MELLLFVVEMDWPMAVRDLGRLYIVCKTVRGTLRASEPRLWRGVCQRDPGARSLLSVLTVSDYRRFYRGQVRCSRVGVRAWTPPCIRDYVCSFELTLSNGAKCHVTSRPRGVSANSHYFVFDPWTLPFPNTPEMWEQATLLVHVSRVTGETVVLCETCVDDSSYGSSYGPGSSLVFEACHTSLQVTEDTGSVALIEYCLTLFFVDSRTVCYEIIPWPYFMVDVERHFCDLFEGLFRTREPSVLGRRLVQT